MQGPGFSNTLRNCCAALLFICIKHQEIRGGHLNKIRGRDDRIEFLHNAED
ncbi:unnamed protein product [Staurois parvus]|uniref:Uncharacterized protein n=1 Tax=Staurois parvus TaxID=386267 RepID=A0ABN9B119_9NEOB|nr:unnamed protein product [Staurois parvus]